MARIWILVVALGLVPVAARQTTDADFFMKAAEAGVRDVETARYVMEKASHPDVKDFARRVAIDRSRINEELLKLSQSRSVTLDADPLRVDLTEPLPAGRAASALAGLEGAALDRAFLEHTLKAHDEAIGLFDEQADKGKDAEVKAWAERVHQTLQDLAKRAKDLQEKISG